VDGNERVGAHAALLFVRANEMEYEIAPKELAGVTLAVARGELSVEALTIWFKQQVRRREG
jgi:prophage maintenance system killer protein